MKENGTDQVKTVGCKKRLVLWIVVSGAVFFLRSLLVFEIVKNLKKNTFVILH